MTFLNGAEGRSVSELPETLFGPTIQLEMPLFFDFDVELKLFLGNHYGQNPPADKTFFQKTPTIMGRMSQIALEFGRERGGRVFIDNQRYYFVDRSPRGKNTLRSHLAKGH